MRFTTYHSPSSCERGTHITSPQARLHSKHARKGAPGVSMKWASLRETPAEELTDAALFLKKAVGAEAIFEGAAGDPEGREDSKVLETLNKPFKP